MAFVTNIRYGKVVIFSTYRPHQRVWVTLSREGNCPLGRQLWAVGDSFKGGGVTLSSREEPEILGPDPPLASSLAPDINPLQHELGSTHN